jgi:hypothetical protein
MILDFRRLQKSGTNLGMNLEKTAVRKDKKRHVTNNLQ